MQSIRSFSPIMRAIGVIGVVAALVTSITFAALSDTAALEDNQFSTATADLLIFDSGTTSYVDSITGFDFAGVVPGVETAAYSFNLLNNGGVDLDLTVDSTVGSITGSVDPDKVHWRIVNDDTATEETYTHTEITTGPVVMPGSPLAAGDNDDFSVYLTIDVDAVSGTSASVTDIDWTFEGTQPTPAP